MKTDDLISVLATGAEPVPRHAVGNRYAVTLVPGVAVACLLMLALFGLRPDLSEAARLPLFWVKLGFVVCLAWASLLATLRLSRPGRRLGWVPIAWLAPVLVIWIMAGMALAGAAPVERPALILGTTWQSCPWAITLLSVPVFVAAFAAMRKAAPTQLPLAGAAAGLLAGTLGALVYCLHCPEVETPFVATWYLIGMLIPGLAGRLLGPRLLRW